MLFEDDVRGGCYDDHSSWLALFGVVNWGVRRGWDALLLAVMFTIIQVAGKVEDLYKCQLLDILQYLCFTL